MSIDKVTGRIVQNRVYDKINYQTSFTDFKTFLEYCRYMIEIQPVQDKDVNKLLGQKRAEFTSWQGSTDSHAKISLLQYGLIIQDNHGEYVLSPMGYKFLSCFDQNNDIVVTREQLLETLYEMISLWHQCSDSFDIHPGLMILKLMLDSDLHGYFTDQDLACICNNSENRRDSQYEDIKKQVLEFRASGKVYTREEKKKTYTLLTGYANNWEIFILDPHSTSEIKIVRLCDDFRKVISEKMKVDVGDRVLSDSEFGAIVKEEEDFEAQISSWEEKYGIEGRILVSHYTRVAQIQEAFRNRLIDYYGKRCLMCGITNKDMLIASHIKRDADCDSISEKVDNNNGFLLCANHDKLFDKYLISFDFIDGKIKISKSLSKEEKKILCIDEDYVLPEKAFSEKTQEYLVYHNEEFEKKELLRVDAV